MRKEWALAMSDDSVTDEEAKRMLTAVRPLLNELEKKEKESGNICSITPPETISPTAS